MMFIVRTRGPRPDASDVVVKLSRATPAIIPEAAAKTDFFCLGSAEAMAALRAGGWAVIELHDGYYEDGCGGGVGIWGQGRYWEIRDTALTIKEAVGPAPPTEAGATESEPVNVRGAIFGV